MIACVSILTTTGETRPYPGDTVELLEGIEPPSSDYKTEVMAVIRQKRLVAGVGIAPTKAGI